LETLYPLTDSALKQLADIQHPHPKLLKEDHCQQAQVVRYVVLKEKFKDSALITEHITDRKEDTFVVEYQIMMQLHPTNLEVFLYFWWKIKEYQLRGVQTLDLQVECISCATQTSRVTE
jgi:hypothetical protein